MPKLKFRIIYDHDGDANIVSLGEGWTPLFKTGRLAATLPTKLDLRKLIDQTLVHANGSVVQHR